MRLPVLRKLSSIVVAGLLLTGCLAKTNSGITTLLEKPYEGMTDVALVAHEQSLNDALARPESARKGAVTLGVGFGSWGSNLGYGISADRQINGANSAATENSLRVRRDEVRAEMRKRGLLPPE